jgi:hypothetical protein
MNKNLIMRAKDLENAVSLENKKILLNNSRINNIGRSMLSKGSNGFEKQNPTLLSSQELFNKKEGSNKENLSLLERGLLEGNEFVKIHIKGRVNKPAVVNEVVETRYKNITPYDDRNDKLMHYVDKYNLPYSRAGVKKTMKELAEDVHRFEKKHLKALIKTGLDKKYKEYGNYVKLI